MQAQVEIGFDQLVQLVKKLPQTQRTKVKQELETQIPIDKEREDFRELLLNGLTFSQKQLGTIAKTRQKIDKWRRI